VRRGARQTAPGLSGRWARGGAGVVGGGRRGGRGGPGGGAGGGGNRTGGVWFRDCRFSVGGGGGVWRDHGAGGLVVRRLTPNRTLARGPGAGFAPGPVGDCRSHRGAAKKKGGGGPVSRAGPPGNRPGRRFLQKGADGRGKGPGVSIPGGQLPKFYGGLFLGGKKSGGGPRGKKRKNRTPGRFKGAG